MVDALISICKYSCIINTLAQVKNVYSMFSRNSVFIAHINPKGNIAKPITPTNTALNFVVSISIFRFPFLRF